MRKFKKSGFLKNKSLDIVSRFFLSSFIVISFFYVAPIIINFTDKNFNNKEFTNNSKNILNNTLNKSKIKNLGRHYAGKVRDNYYINNQILMVPQLIL